MFDRRHLAVATALFGLAACASAQDKYPSLDIRPAERVSGSFDPVQPAPSVPPPPSAGVLGQLDGLTAQASEAHRAFLAEVERGRDAVSAGRGAAEGSDRWADAEVALAEILLAHSSTMVPLADLDALYVAAATEGKALERIADAREQVAALVANEEATLASLHRSLGE